MKKFIGFVALLLVTIGLLLVVLDIVYTQVYLQSSQRGKIDYVYNSKARNYDVVILGSSRANNHFVSQLFEEKGLKTFNFGMSGSHLFEADLLLKLMIERKYQIKNLIIETDLNISNENQSESSSSKFLPYIHDSEIVRSHFFKEDNFFNLYYVPFYRYVAYDPQIGFRETFLSAIRKESALMQKGGYYALYSNEKGRMKNDLTNLKPIRNKYYEDIKLICAENHINLIAVMTPMCTNVKGMDYFEKVNSIYPEIHNYENVVEGDQYFSSCGHMNDTGAKVFTKKIIKDFFKL
jgi:hypothetical protein